MEIRYMNSYREKNCMPCDIHPLVESTKLLAPNDIIFEVCKFLNLNMGLVMGNKRDADLVYARHLICDILYSDAFLKLTFLQIGRLLGNRDHSTIVHAVRNVRNQCETDEIYRDKYRRLHLFLYNSDKYFKYSDKYFVYQKENKIKKSREFMVN
jgi:hypothetical protein